MSKSVATTITLHRLAAVNQIPGDAYRDTLQPATEEHLGVKVQYLF